MYFPPKGLGRVCTTQQKNLELAKYTVPTAKHKSSNKATKKKKRPTTAEQESASGVCNPKSCVPDARSFTMRKRWQVETWPAKGPTTSEKFQIFQWENLHVETKVLSRDAVCKRLNAEERTGSRVTIHTPHKKLDRQREERLKEEARRLRWGCIFNHCCASAP